MNKNEINNIIKEYLTIFPNEQERLKSLKDFIKNNNNESIIDWNNFEGHIVSSAFIYSIKEKKFLLIYHKDFKMYLYPGGHIEANDKNVLNACIRELKEETGITFLSYRKVHQ